MEQRLTSNFSLTVCAKTILTIASDPALRAGPNLKSDFLDPSTPPSGLNVTISLQMTSLRDEVKKVCQEYQLVYGENDEMGSAWVDKVLQLYQVMVVLVTNLPLTHRGRKARFKIGVVSLPTGCVAHIAFYFIKTELSRPLTIR